MLGKQRLLNYSYQSLGGSILMRPFVIAVAKGNSHKL